MYTAQPTTPRASQDTYSALDNELQIHLAYAMQAYVSEKRFCTMYDFMC
jgi:hypothetical protein